MNTGRHFKESRTVVTALAVPWAVQLCALHPTVPRVQYTQPLSWPLSDMDIDKHWT